MDLSRFGNDRACVALVAVAAFSAQSCTAVAGVADNIHPYGKVIKVNPVSFVPINAWSR